MKTHKHTNTQTHKHTNTQTHKPDSYLLNSSIHPDVNRTFKLNRYHPNPKHLLSKPLPLLTSLTSLTKLTSPTKPKLKQSPKLKLSPNPNLKLKLKPLLLFMTLPLALCTLLPLSASAALKATTAKTIQGSKPYLLLKDGETKLLSLNELLGFSMPKQDGSEGTEQIDASMASKVITAPAGMRFQDITALVAVDGQLHDVDALVGDDEGDALLKENTSVSGQMKATWSDGGKVVADLSKTLSACGGPYTLKLEIPKAVSANTKYGDPHTNNYGTHSGVTYTFTSAGQGICYLQPGSMNVQTGKEGVDIKYANGYNPEVWEPDGKYYHKGFKASSGFPTTGFYKAKFNVIGSGSDQRNYLCRVDPGSWVELSGSASQKLGQNCTVTYNTVKKPTTPVTIYLDYKVSGGSDWKQVDSYTISVPKKWGIAKGKMAFADEGNLSKSTTFFVYDTCRTVVDGKATPATTRAQALNMTAAGKAWRQKYLYRRDELTNSPYADRGKYPENTYNPGGYLSRDVDGTFMGEWGFLISSYLNSVSYIWTAEVAETNQFQYIIRDSGDVDSVVTSSSNNIAFCRGE